ncbi:hypothetical protein [Escherichia coli]|uniref:hypothetical protein n=1 Tax=Escherichia coli TaxID=562 RepID=UPI0006A587D3|nr:hypothetical protein [Escherichia coli]MCV0835345.1 hypothetical protein [Escherichia coli]
MSNIDKQALRLTAEKAKDNFIPNFMVPTRDVLELLDELEKMQAQSSKWCEAFHKAVSVGARYEERIAELEAREQKNLAEERQRVIDGLCTIGETAWEIEEYMKEWDAKHPHEAATAGIGVKGE